MGKTNEDLYARWLPLACSPRTVAVTVSRRASPGSSARRSPNSFRRVGGDALSPDAIHLRSGQGLERPRPADAARAVRRVPRGRRLLEHRRRYLFGSDILVAPLLEAGTKGRDVYLPPGNWIDYQTGRAFTAGWHTIEAGPIPVVMLVREGAAIPHIAVAQSTAFMDWSKLDIEVFGVNAAKASGLVALPDGELMPLSLNRRGTNFTLAADPLAGKVTWTIHRRGEVARP